MSYKEHTQEIALRIRKLRRAHGYGVQGMARTLNLNRSSYYRLENAKSRPGMPTMLRLAYDLNISLDWLILDRGEMHYKKETAPVRDTLNTAEMSDDIKELLEHILEIPLLRHQVLATFYKFKEENSEMIEREMKKE